MDIIEKIHFSDFIRLCADLIFAPKYLTMKTIIGSMLACLTVSVSSQNVNNIVSENIRYCESTYPYNDGLLIANFGTEELNPLNSEGKGYIVFYKDGKSEIAIPADGNLSAPKGMFIRNGYLYVCDVNKIVVYNLEKKNDKPRTINLPEGNLFVNDLAADGNSLYASVTNTDKIFRIDISNPANPGNPQEWLSISGPNGLLIKDGTMYVASYPADGTTKPENVIYEIKNLASPKVRKLTETAGQYDGIAFAADGKSLLVTNWTPAQLSRVSLSDGSITTLNINLDKTLVGPADITVHDGYIYIPDLPNSRVVIVEEPKYTL